MKLIVKGKTQTLAVINDCFGKYLDYPLMDTAQALKEKTSMAIIIAHNNPI